MKFAALWQILEVVGHTEAKFGGDWSQVRPLDVFVCLGPFRLPGGVIFPRWRGFVPSPCVRLLLSGPARIRQEVLCSPRSGLRSGPASRFPVQAVVVFLARVAFGSPAICPSRFPYRVFIVPGRRCWRFGRASGLPVPRPSSSPRARPLAPPSAPAPRLWSPAPVRGNRSPGT
jgi:hypothetical protein